MSLTIGGFVALLQVFDMPTSLGFYRDVLGFQVASEVPADDRCDWVRLTLHGSELMLNTAYEEDERPPTPDPVRVTAHGDATLYFICASADTAYRLLREAGLEPSEPATAHYGMRQTYVKDPDGYELCFQSLAVEPDDSRPTP